MPRFSASFTSIMVLTLVGIATFSGGAFGLMARAADPIPQVEAVMPPADTVVKINLKGGGHGSGVLIGNGFVLTAGHVTTGETTVTVQTIDGAKYDGEVLWVSDMKKGGYDVSLVYVEKLAAYKGAKLSCAPNYVGQEIILVGNPLGDENVTAWGRISGTDVIGYVDENHFWRVLVSVDVSAAPGNSGGPVFDDKGEIVGILVAGMVEFTRGNFPYSYIVPGEAICHVMGRA